MRSRIYGVWRVCVVVEHGARKADRRLVTKAWFREMTEPYRVANGIRFRLGDRAFQFGVCKPNPNSNALRQLGGHAVTGDVNEIAKWGR